MPAERSLQSRHAVMLALLLAGVSFFLQAGVRLDMADEGLLWYGSRAVLQGLVPLRDFSVYDPGRYYWTAAVSRIFGGGLLSMRFAAWLFQALCLSFGFLALARSFRSVPKLVLAAVMAMLWQFWWFRFFDAGIPMIAVFFATRLAENPNTRRHWEAGIFSGLAIFFGINHGIYVLGGFLLLMACLNSKATRSFAAGLGIGSIPLVVMLVAVPGFWLSYRDHLIYHAGHLARGATDFRRLIAWPWELPWHEATAQVPHFWFKRLHFLNICAQGAAFLTLVLFYVFCAPYFLIKKENVKKMPLLAGSVFIGIFYFHHVLTRGDVGHLGEGIFPLISGACALFAMKTPRGKNARCFLASWVVLVTLLAALPLTNLFFEVLVPKDRMRFLSVGRDTVWIPENQAFFLDRTVQMVKEIVPPGEPLLIAPMLTTLYCILDRRAPVRDIYFYQPQPERFQEATIRELEAGKVNWVILGDPVFDNKPERRFSNTHPVLWGYLAAHFEAVSDDQPWPAHYLMKRKI